MPVHCTYNADNNYLECVVEGALTIDVFETTLKGLLNSNEYPPDVDTLWDLRNYDFSAVDAETQRRWVAIRKEHPERGNAKMAILVNSDMNFGKSRMYEMWSSGLPQQMRVFRDYQEAQAWLLDDR